jgi:hypothetical protein
MAATITQKSEEETDRINLDIAERHSRWASIAFLKPARMRKRRSEVPTNFGKKQLFSAEKASS